MAVSRLALDRKLRTMVVGSLVEGMMGMMGTMGTIIGNLVDHRNRYRGGVSLVSFWSRRGHYIFWSACLHVHIRI